MIWRAVISFKDDKETIGENFGSKEHADAWVLEQAEMYDVKTSVVADKEDLSTKEITHF